MERRSEEKRVPFLFLFKSLLFSYIVTAIFLLVLTFLVYKAGIGEKAVSVGVIVIYVAATFFGGFITGKKMQNRKFLWGLLLGSVYFLVLLLVSVLVSEEAGSVGEDAVTTLVLCAAGGMLGGMLS